MKTRNDILIIISLTFIIGCIFIWWFGIVMGVLPGYEYGGKDPNWDKTHVQMRQFDEALQLSGDDILLDKITLTNYYSNYFYEFTLEHSVGGENNREEWKELWAWIEYGEHTRYFNPYELELTIFLTKTQHTGARHSLTHLLNGGHTLVINGAKIRSNEIYYTDPKDGRSYWIDYDDFKNEGYGTSYKYDRTFYC